MPKSQMIKWTKGKMLVTFYRTHHHTYYGKNPDKSFQMRNKIMNEAFLFECSHFFSRLLKFMTHIKTKGYKRWLALKLVV